MYQVTTLRIIDAPWSIAAGDATRMSRQPLEEHRPMALPRPQRKLAAILAADVAGYSRLMSLDEAGTRRGCASSRPPFRLSSKSMAVAS